MGNTSLRKTGNLEKVKNTMVLLVKNGLMFLFLLLFSPDRELLHTKKRQEDTHSHLKAVLGDAMISCDITMVGPEVTACSQAPAFLPSTITGEIFGSEIEDRPPSGSQQVSSNISVTMDNSLSPAHTLVQIVCHDHKGLLYDIMRTLKDYNIQVYCFNNLIFEKYYSIFHVSDIHYTYSSCFF